MSGTDADARARELLNSGDFEPALREFERARAEGNDSVELWCGLAVCLRRLGRADEAIQTLNDILQRKGDDPRLHVELGDTLLELGFIDRATAAFEAAERTPSTFSADDWMIRGSRLSGDGRVADASQFFRRAVERGGGVVAWRLLGTALVDSGDPEEGETAYRSALNDFPEEPTLENGLGVALSQLGRDEEAAHCFEVATRQQPDVPLYWTNLGLQRMTLNEAPGAVAAFARAIELDPKDAEAWVLLGNARTLESDYEAAIEGYERALELDPDQLWAVENLAILRYNMYEYAEALALFERAQNMDPTNAEFWRGKTLSLLRLDRAEEALNYLDTADGDMTETLTWLRTRASVLSDGLRRHAAALECLEHALAVDPEAWDLMPDLAETLVKAGQVSRGREMAVRVLEHGDSRRMIEIGMRLVTLVADAMADDGPARADSFEQFIACRGDESYEVAAKDGSWNFTGLRDAVRGANLIPEGRFLVETAIDLADGSVIPGQLTFFRLGENATV